MRKSHRQQMQLCALGMPVHAFPHHSIGIYVFMLQSNAQFMKCMPNVRY